LPNIGAVFKACLAALAVAWAMSAEAQGTAMSAEAEGTGTQGAVVAHRSATSSQFPAIRLLHHQTSLASTCGGSAFDVNTFIDVGPTASADVKVTAPGVGLVEEFVDDTGANLNSFKGTFPSFHIKPFGGGLPPNTLITITITTYTDVSLTGSVSSVSSLTFNCTTGVVESAPLNPTSAIPSLSSYALAATAVVLLLFGAMALRRTEKAGRPRR